MELTDQELEALHEAAEERAAILEYESGMLRKEAEQMANEMARNSVFRYRLTDNENRWLVVIAPGDTLKDIRKDLRERFPGRLLEVIQYDR